MTNIRNRYVRVDERQVIQVELHILSAGSGTHGRYNKSQCHWFQDRHLQEILQLLKVVIIQRVEIAREKGNLSKPASSSTIITGNTVRVGYTFKKKAERHTCLVPSLLLNEDSTHWPEPGPQMSSFYVHSEKLVVFACSVEPSSPQGMSQLVRALREGGETPKAGVSISSYFNKLPSASPSKQVLPSVRPQQALPLEPASEDKKTAIRNILKRSGHAASKKRKRMKKNESDVEGDTKCKSEPPSLFSEDNIPKLTSRKLKQPLTDSQTDNHIKNPNLEHDKSVSHSNPVPKNAINQSDRDYMQKSDCECEDCGIEAECHKAQIENSILKNEDLVENFNKKNISCNVLSKSDSVQSSLLHEYASSSFQNAGKDNATDWDLKELDVIDCDELVNVNQGIVVHKDYKSFDSVSKSDCRKLSSSPPNLSVTNDCDLQAKSVDAVVDILNSKSVDSSSANRDFVQENTNEADSGSSLKMSPVFPKLKSRKITEESCEKSEPRQGVDSMNPDIRQTMEDELLPKLTINKTRSRKFKWSKHSRKKNIEMNAKPQNDLQDLEQSQPETHDSCTFSVEKTNCTTTARILNEVMLQSTSPSEDFVQDRVSVNMSDCEQPTLDVYVGTDPNNSCKKDELQEAKIIKSISENDLPVLTGLHYHNQKRTHCGKSTNSKKNSKHSEKPNYQFSDTLPDLDLTYPNEPKETVVNDSDKNTSVFNVINNRPLGHRLSVCQLLTATEHAVESDILDVSCLEEELLDCILVEEGSDVPTVKNERDMETRDEIRSMSTVSELGEEHICYLVLHNESYLREIFRGETKCERHDSYKEGGRSRKNLNYQVHLGLFTDEQHDVVMETLMSIFCKKHHKYMDYLLKVLLPEMLIKIYMEIHNTNHAETEKLMVDALRQPGGIVDF